MIYTLVLVGRRIYRLRRTPHDKSVSVMFLLFLAHGMYLERACLWQILPRKYNTLHVDRGPLSSSLSMYMFGLFFDVPFQFPLRCVVSVPLQCTVSVPVVLCRSSSFPMHRCSFISMYRVSSLCVVPCHFLFDAPI